VVAAGVIVTVPVPAWVKVAAAPETGLPPASLTVMVKVAGFKPSFVTVAVVENAVTVEPTI
jgi:hypothetical protein